MLEKFAFFLPTRKGSERVLNKNTRTFAGIEGGLLKLKIEQLLDVPDIPIYISTNDDETVRIAESFNNSRIKIIIRPDVLCLSSTNIEDFISYIPQIIKESHIFWVHATAPFVDSTVYKQALNEYNIQVVNGDYDSLFSVTKIQQFIWDGERNLVINHDRSIVKWPRTQDLKPLFEINHAFYVNSKANYLEMRDRIGVKPFLFELDKVQSIDIDWEDDFKIAELVYEATSK